MLYEVCTRKFDGWCMYYNENTLYISAQSEEEAREIYKKNKKVGRKKIYVSEVVRKKGIVEFV